MYGGMIGNLIRPGRAERGGSQLTEELLNLGEVQEDISYPSFYHYKLFFLVYMIQFISLHCEVWFVLFV